MLPNGAMDVVYPGTYAGRWSNDIQKHENFQEFFIVELIFEFA